jgi:hypothetical protein
MKRKLSAFIALTTTACSSWQAQTGPTPAAVQAAREAHANQPIRLELRSGANVELYDAAVVGDSIIGMSAPTNQQTRTRVAVATDDVERVTTSQFSAGRTILAVLGITIAALLIIVASSAGSSSSSNSSCSSASASFAPASVVA